jgi:cbb3-type cytochrome c oxidase subunit III
MKFKKLVLSLFSTAALSVVFLSISMAKPAAKADGESLFKGKCAMCHGADGKGYPAIKTPDFTSPKWQASITDTQIITVIKGGKKGTAMPAFGSQFSAAQITALKDYIRSLKSAKKK